MRKKRIAIIGAGHNGLIAACYLAEKGHTVHVYEKRHVLGGCASTEAVIIPKVGGFKISPAAYVVSLLDLEIVNHLKLKENGLRIIPRDPISFTPDLDGPGLFFDSVGNNINEYDQMDSNIYNTYEKTLTQIAEIIEPFLRMSQKMNWRNGFRSFRLLKNILSTPYAIECFTGSATSFLDRWFVSDILKATLASDAIIGLFGSPSHPGSAYVLLHHVMGNVCGKRGSWGYVHGGMGRLSEILAEIFRSIGSHNTILSSTPIEQILVKNNKVIGVLTEDGKILHYDAVASSISYHVTFKKLLIDTEIPTSFSNSIDSIDYSSGSAKINLCLDRLPSFAEKNGIPGTIHLCPSIEYIERAYFDAAVNKKISERPIIEITIPSKVDISLAPSGKHVMGMFIQYVPLCFPNTEENRELLFDICMKEVEKYSPGFRNLILHKQVLLPKDLEETYGLTGGNIFQGSMSLSNLGPLRPAFGWADHRTPVKGMYMCGAATHPGGGVMGLPGRNAALKMLKDL